MPGVAGAGVAAGAGVTAGVAAGAGTAGVVTGAGATADFAGAAGVTIVFDVLFVAQDTKINDIANITNIIFFILLITP